MSVTGFNRRRRLAKKAEPETTKESQEDASQPSGNDRRGFLMAEIERLTEKRPGANTKDETLEKQYAELTKDPE